MPPKPAPIGKRYYYLLFILPFAWQLGLAPFANSVTWHPLGLPFAMVWQMAGILVTSAILLIIYRLDKAREHVAANEDTTAGPVQ